MNEYVKKMIDRALAEADHGRVSGSPVGFRTVDVPDPVEEVQRLVDLIAAAEALREVDEANLLRLALGLAKDATVGDVFRAAVAEIERLRREVAGLERIMTDMASDSAAYLLGVEHGVAAANKASNRGVTGTIANVVMKATQMEVSVGGLQITTKDDGGIDARIDGVPVDGFQIQLDCWRDPPGVTWRELADQQRVIDGLRDELFRRDMDEAKR